MAKISRPLVSKGPVTSAGMMTRSKTKDLMASSRLASGKVSGMMTRSKTKDLMASTRLASGQGTKRMKIYPGGSATFDESMGRKK